MNKEDMNRIIKGFEEETKGKSKEVKENAMGLTKVTSEASRPLHVLLTMVSTLSPKLKRVVLLGLIHSLILTYTENIDEAMGFISELKTGVEKIDKKINEG